MILTSNRLIRIANTLNKPVGTEGEPKISLTQDVTDVAPSLTEVRQELTTFVENSSLKGRVETSEHSVPGVYNDTPTVADVAKYLSRPQELFTAAVTPSSPLFVSPPVKIGSALWSQHLHYNKVLGAYGIRATTCFKISIACTPYHAGVLKMTSLLHGDSDLEGLSRVQLSQLPGQMVDYPTNCSAEYRVPYSCYRDYVLVNEFTEHEFAQFGVYQFLSLNATTEAGPVSVSVYWWLEDVELIGAIPVAITNGYATAREEILKAAGVVPTGVDADRLQIGVTQATF